MQIEIDFDVFKALTALRHNEVHSYNDVLRELLAIDSIHEPDDENSLHAIGDAIGRPLGKKGFYSKGVFLPSGTELRARYKHHEYRARIIDDRWLDEHDKEYTSSSAAAGAITGTNVNGLRFWEAKRPGDMAWVRLEMLRAR